MNQWAKYHISGRLCNTIFVCFGITYLTSLVPYNCIEKLGVQLKKSIYPKQQIHRHTLHSKPDTPTLRLMAGGIRSCLWYYWQYTSGLGDQRDFTETMTCIHVLSCQKTVLHIDLWTVHIILPQFSALQLTINKIKGCHQLPEPQLAIVLVQIVVSPTQHSFSKPIWKSRRLSTQN